MTQNVLTNDEAVTGSKHFFRLFSLLLKGMKQTSGVLLSQFQYQPTLLYSTIVHYIRGVFKSKRDYVNKTRMNTVRKKAQIL
jgi:hypothetical protein